MARRDTPRPDPQHAGVLKRGGPEDDVDAFALKGLRGCRLVNLLHLALHVVVHLGHVDRARSTADAKPLDGADLLHVDGARDQAVSMPELPARLGSADYR